MGLVLCYGLFRVVMSCNVMLCYVAFRCAMVLRIAMMWHVSFCCVLLRQVSLCKALIRLCRVMLLPVMLCSCCYVVLWFNMYVVSSEVILSCYALL